MRDVRSLFTDWEFGLHESIGGLRPQQEEALAWALERQEPYLFINAPTGSGKTLLLGAYGSLVGKRWTYGVHTIRLQQQVERTFPGLPVLTGRANHPCWVGEETHHRPVMADEGICVTGEWCPHKGVMSDDGEPAGDLCPYYAQRKAALGANARVTNYAMLLADRRVRQATGVLLADEAHRLEDAVVGSAGVFLSRRGFRRFGVDLPEDTKLDSVQRWAAKVLRELPPDRGLPNPGLITARASATRLAGLKEEDVGKWLVTQEDNGVRVEPIWGAPFVMANVFGHDVAPGLADPLDGAAYRDHGVQKVLFTSATLMGAEYVADILGLPAGSWAYLDLPSTFDPANRPVNFAPVMRMNYKNTATPEGRRPMIEAIDRLVEFYVTLGRGRGVIHAVSNRLRDNILTESRWRAIMVSEAEEHEARVARGEASVVVAANLAEGWDGVDDLVRFTIMPKVPFPSLGDERVKIRKEEDGRSFDYAALVAVVQGAGRGVRHEEDYADTWILDGAWNFLYQRRKDWLPESFTDAYHHNVRLP